MKWHIALGSVFIVIAIGLLGYVALGEQERMETFTRSYHSRQIEKGASLFENNCRSCHGPQGGGIPGVAPALNTAEIFSGARLEAVGFSGTVEDYLSGVIAAGRPVPSEGTNYPQRMPTWSQEFGGPLREDQIEALVAFIMNWEDRALAGGEAPPAPASGFVGEDITVELPAGDPEAGRQLSSGALGCAGCHELSNVGPPWAGDGGPGVGARAETRIEQGDYTGQASTAEEYLIESVVLPEAYIVEGYESGIMPPGYGGRITAQELADLVAYMLSLR